MNKDIMIDAISKIDQKYIIEYTQYETRLQITQAKKRRINRALLISAACLMLTVCMLLVSLPLSLIVLGSEPVQNLGSKIIENVIFPLDQQLEDPKDPDHPEEPAQTLLQINWVEWKFTEKFFNALGAGTDDSTIDKLQSMQGGFVGESMQNLGDFLERLYEYYMKHKKEIDKTENESESETDTDQGTDTGIDPSYEVDGSKGLEYLFLGTDRGYAVSGMGECTDEVVTIPAAYNGQPVTAIGSSAFENSQIVEVILPDTVTSISFVAFRNCGLLTKINLPESLETIEKYAFKNCAALQSIEIPSKVTALAEEAFYGCESLRFVSMSGVTSIGESAFQNCSALQTVSMENVEEIDDYAFEHCVSLEALEFTNIVSIGKHAFDSCKSLKQIRYGHELKALDDYAFANCESIIAFTFIDSITELGIGTFSGCTSLNNVHFDCSSIIPDYTFDGCTGLQSMLMYYPLENVGAYAFRNCRVVLTGGSWSVKEIGEHAFDGSGETTISLNTLESDTIDAYAMANCYNLWRVVLPSHIKKIEPYAMYNCPELEEIEFWGSKEAWTEIEIGENAIAPGTRISFNDGTSIRYDPDR